MMLMIHGYSGWWWWWGSHRVGTWWIRGRFGTDVMSWTHRCRLTVKFDKSATKLSLDAFCYQCHNINIEKKNKDGLLGTLPQGLQPSQEVLAWTHWSHTCLEVVAREADAEPFLRTPVVGNGFSLAWHLLTCLDRRSLRGELGVWSNETWKGRTSEQTDRHNIDIYKVYRQCLKNEKEK